MDEGRSERFVRDNDLMGALTELNAMLEKMDRPAVDELQHPIVFIVGCPRSGTTVMMQWLASLGVLAYPSNLIARFYANPYVGVRIQQVLHTYDSKKQIFPEVYNGENFNSHYGHTVGALAPSEYWYFWRRFFHFGEIQYLDDFHSNIHDAKGFVSELALMEKAFGKPLLMKAMILNWNLPELYKLFPRCLFIDVSRDSGDNAESLYFARQAFFNDVTKWFSFKPPEYTQLKNLSPLEQVAGQVHFTRKAVNDGLAKIPASSVLKVSYEAFCVSPATVYAALSDRMQAMGYVLPEYMGNDQFAVANISRLAPVERATIDNYLAELEE
ncbi:MAG: sulfotransferase [Pseudomonadales bacterium]|jgi:hypothetical protein